MGRKSREKRQREAKGTADPFVNFLQIPTRLFTPKHLLISGSTCFTVDSIGCFCYFNDGRLGLITYETQSGFDMTEVFTAGREDLFLAGLAVSGQEEDLDETPTGKKWAVIRRDQPSLRPRPWLGLKLNDKRRGSRDHHEVAAHNMEVLEEARLRKVQEANQRRAAVRMRRQEVATRQLAEASERLAEARERVYGRMARETECLLSRCRPLKEELSAGSTTVRTPVHPEPRPKSAASPMARIAAMRRNFFK